MAGILSGKRVLIDKTNTTVVIVVSVAVFITVFSLVATKTLISQAAYQNRVISAKRTAVSQLKADIDATQDLKQRYEAFVSTTTNAIGGSASGTQGRDGNNAKIVLDALPSSYDFPVLATSLDKLLASQSVKINSIAGTDDELAQASNQSSSSPQPIAIPFQLAVSSDYDAIKNVVTALERSIRPIQSKTVEISGSKNDLTLSIGAETYYQPAKSMNIQTEIVK